MGVKSQLTEKTGQPVPAPAGTEEVLPRREEDSPALKVLVVDDDEAVLDAIAGLLTSWGYEVVAAKDGAEALPLLLAEDGPCMAVLDWMMPGMNGPEICRLIRATRTSRYIYMILVTARGLRQDLIGQLGLGFRIFQRLDDLAMHLGDNIARRLFRHEGSHPEIEIGIGNAGLNRRRHLGQGRCAPGAAHG